MDKNENMTALMSAFARAYHTEHNEITMYSDPLAHRILGEEDYTAIARNIVGGIKFFEPNFSGTDDEALRAAVEKRLAPGPLVIALRCAEHAFPGAQIGAGNAGFLAELVEYGGDDIKKIG